MTDVTRILPAIERGEPQAADALAHWPRATEWGMKLGQAQQRRNRWDQAVVPGRADRRRFCSGDIDSAAAGWGNTVSPGLGRLSPAAPAPSTTDLQGLVPEA
jgi:hypothetical protein